MIEESKVFDKINHLLHVNRDLMNDFLYRIKNFFIYNVSENKIKSLDIKRIKGISENIINELGLLINLLK